VRRGERCRTADWNRFFRRELEAAINLDNLLLEAYILVKRAKFTYSDVKTMTRFERMMFLKFLKDESEREANASK